MSQPFRDALSTAAGRRMLLELMAYTATLPESLMLGATNLLTPMQRKATEEERAKGREPQKPAKGRVTHG